MQTVFTKRNYIHYILLIESQILKDCIVLRAVSAGIQNGIRFW